MRIGEGEISVRTITLTMTDIPDKVFIPVVRKRDIIKARILSSSEKSKLPKGSSDVRVETPLGHEGLLSRTEIMGNYFHLSGHKIVLSGWKTGTDYILTRNDHTPAFAMMIPLNCIVELNGNINKKKNETGQYLVCLTNEKGEIDRESASLLSRPMFRKMFNVTPNEIIAKHKGSGGKLLGKNVGKTVENENSLPEQINTGNKLLSRNNIAEPSSQPPVQPLAQKNKPEGPKVQNQDNKLMAVGKLLNEENKIVGFVIQDSKGMTRQISKREMLNLCSQKLVDNIMLATKDTDGSKYLRGNGIKIESLTTFYI